MITIEAGWTALMVLAIACVLFILQERRDRRRRRRIASDFCDRRLQVETAHARELHRLADQWREKWCALGRAKTRDRRADTRQITSYRALLSGTVPALKHVATIRPGTAEGRSALQCLWALHCLGLWTPGKNEARLLANGQREAGCNPTQISALVRKIGAEAGQPPSSADAADGAGIAKATSP